MPRPVPAVQLISSASPTAAIAARPVPLALTPSDAGPQCKRRLVCWDRECEVNPWPPDCLRWDNRRIERPNRTVSSTAASKPRHRDPDRVPCAQVRQLEGSPFLFIAPSQAGLSSTSSTAARDWLCRFSATASVDCPAFKRKWWFKEPMIYTATLAHIHFQWWTWLVLLLCILPPRRVYNTYLLLWSAGHSHSHSHFHFHFLVMTQNGYITRLKEVYATRAPALVCGRHAFLFIPMVLYLHCSTEERPSVAFPGSILTFLSLIGTVSIYLPNPRRRSPLLLTVPLFSNASRWWALGL